MPWWEIKIAGAFKEPAEESLTPHLHSQQTVPFLKVLGQRIVTQFKAFFAFDTGTITVDPSVYVPRSFPFSSYTLYVWLAGTTVPRVSFTVESLISAGTNCLGLSTWAKACVKRNPAISTMQVDTNFFIFLFLNFPSDFVGMKISSSNTISYPVKGGFFRREESWVLAGSFGGTSSCCSFERILIYTSGPLLLCAFHKH